MSSKNENFLAVVVALLCVYVIWGSTYLGIKIAIETLPPFFMAALRFLFAGGLLYTVVRIKTNLRPTRREWQDASIVGILLLLGGNGFVSFAEKSIPSSIAALVIATVPLWIIVITRLSNANEQASMSTVLGTGLGFLGVVILIFPFGKTSEMERLDIQGMLFCIGAAVSWSVGTVYSKRAQLPSSLSLSIAMQMIAGGVALLIVSCFMQEWHTLNEHSFSIRSFFALAYLVFFGSFIGYFAYIWLLQNAGAFLASTYAFVNPLVAIFLSYFFAGERLTPRMGVATIMILAAVILITLFKNKKKIGLKMKK